MPDLLHTKPPENWYIIGLTRDQQLQTEYAYTLIHKFSSTENILNIIQEIENESCYRQLGNFPLFIGITRPEIDTPQGIFPLTKKEWRILDYFARNRGKRVSTEELKYHVFEVGEEYELQDSTVLLHVLLTQLRKKFMTIIDSPVISYGSLNCGYYLLDFLPGNLEYLINRTSNSSFIVVDKETKELVQDFYKKLAVIVAKKSLYELQHDPKLRSKHRRYNFLKNNLILKDNFNLSKLILLLKKIRFPTTKRTVLDVTNFKEELTYQ